MKKLALLTLLFAMSMVVSAQNYQDVVYLKNGSVIRGIIIEQTPSVSLKIETGDKSVFVYTFDEIEKIAKETNSAQQLNSKMQSGYMGFIDAGIGFGISEYAKDLTELHFNFINGYRFNDYVTLGLGFGFKYVWYKNNSTLYAPIYADVRVFPLTGKVTPYINLKLGYSFGYSSRFDPEVQGLGLMIDPSFGVTIKNGSKSSMNFGLGFWIQKYNETDLTDNFLHLDFGIGF